MSDLSELNERLQKEFPHCKVSVRMVDVSDKCVPMDLTPLPPREIGKAPEGATLEQMRAIEAELQEWLDLHDEPIPFEDLQAKFHEIVAKIVG